MNAIFVTLSIEKVASELFLVGFIRHPVHIISLQFNKRPYHQCICMQLKCIYNITCHFCFGHCNNWTNNIAWAIFRVYLRPNLLHYHGTSQRGHPRKHCPNNLAPFSGKSVELILTSSTKQFWNSKKVRFSEENFTQIFYADLGH